MAWGRTRSASLKPEERDRTWRRALRAAIAEDWPATESWLERLVESDTGEVDAYFALARLYRRAGALGRAIRMHQNLLLRSDLSGSERTEALFELARDFEVGGYDERAAATYEELLDGAPRHAEAIERLVPLLGGQRAWARALALTKKLRRRSPETAARLEIELLLAQARSSLDEGDHDSARKALKRCLRRDKDCGAAHVLLGEIEVERGKSSRALESWKRAARIDAELARGLYTKLEAGFSARGKPREFEEFVRELLESRPEDTHARIALARTLASRGESTGAIEELARAVEVVAEPLPLRAELGRQLLGAGQDAEALKAYAELLDEIERGADGEETVE